MKTINITNPEEIREIIRKCPYCMVGITDREGNPYVLPMNFAYRDGVLPFPAFFLSLSFLCRLQHHFLPCFALHSCCNCL